MSRWTPPDDLRPGWFRLDEETSLWLRASKVEVAGGRVRVEIDDARIDPHDLAVEPAKWRQAGVRLIEFDYLDQGLVWEE